MFQKKLLGLVLVIIACAGFVFLTPISCAAQTKVACIGDSITEGMGTTNWGLYSYPAQLQNLLGSAYIVNNYGVSGRTLLKKGDYPYWNEQKYTDSKNWQPNIVIIQLGTNDTKSWNWVYKNEFVSNYVELVNNYKALASHPTVYVCYPPTVYPNSGEFVNSESIIVNEMIAMVNQVASQTGSAIINNHTVTANMSQNYSDAVHPNNTGSFAIAYNVFKSLGTPNAGARFYQDANFGGTNYLLPIGAYTGAMILAAGIPNDWMSSLKVPGGYTVEVYQNGNFDGTKWTFTADSSWVGSACNDQMSSVKIFNVASITSGATYKIINRLSGKGLNVPYGSTADNTQLIQWPYSGNSNEKWVITRNSDGTYKIQNVLSLKYVDLSGGSSADGTPIIQYTGNGGSNQNWNITEVDGGYYKITSAATGKAICVEGASTADGAKIIEWTYNASHNDEWALLIP